MTWLSLLLVILESYIRIKTSIITNLQLKIPYWKESHSEGAKLWSGTLVEGKVGNNLRYSLLRDLSNILIQLSRESSRKVVREIG